MDHISELDRDFWGEGLALFALGAVSPWLSMVDEAKWADHVNNVQQLDIETIAACHTPIIDGPFIEEAFSLVRNLPNLGPIDLPDQSMLDQIVEAASVDPES